MTLTHKDESIILAALLCAANEYRGFAANKGHPARIQQAFAMQADEAEALADRIESEGLGIT